ncbi:MAG: 4-(cytidine 5'-diphospho)-2-C-methyl-D-erythritol kinase [Peptococcaceae bacterium]|nr:4-(cytidine 5'-diphospho)-2-C-methyl-D-erythritol kinase [Peptococcaceae bacterium]
MRTLTELAHAKINLTLDVLYRRTDGYHEVEMVMQSIELADRVSLAKTSQGITLQVSSNEIPTDKNNLAWQAAQLMFDKLGLDGGLAIDLEKNIPVAAGLAGGSADAAAVIRGINRLWQLELSLTELLEFGALIGSDIPFCIQEGTALATGRGELLTKLTSCPEMWLVLVKPKVGVATGTVYGSFEVENVTTRPDTSAMLKAIAEGNEAAIVNNMYNVLESTTVNLVPEIEAIRQQLVRAGALKAVMSGSGPTVFGVTQNEVQARSVAVAIAGGAHTVIVTKTHV